MGLQRGLMRTTNTKMEQRLEICYSDLNDLTDCQSGNSGTGWNILAATSYARGNTAKIAVAAEGVITATASGAGTLNGATYTMTPEAVAGVGLKWTVACIPTSLCD